MTFKSFQDSKRWSENVAMSVGDHSLSGVPGFVYDSYCCIEEPAPGNYTLTLERSEYNSKDLAGLEQILWANHWCHECAPDGYTLSHEADNGILGSDLDIFARAACVYFGIECDGDIMDMVLKHGMTPAEAFTAVEGVAGRAAQ